MYELVSGGDASPSKTTKVCNIFDVKYTAVFPSGPDSEREKQASVRGRKGEVKAITAAYEERLAKNNLPSASGAGQGDPSAGVGAMITRSRRWFRSNEKEE